MSKLSKKQETFCQEFIIDFNATRAAEKSGYSKNSARQMGSENLSKPSIQERIKELTQERAERTKVTQDRVVNELAKIAFSNLDDVGRWDEEGNFILKPANEMDQEALAALGSINHTKSFSKEGDLLSTNTKVTKLDKLKALEMLARHTGAFNNDDSGKAVINVQFGNKK